MTNLRSRVCLLLVLGGGAAIIDRPASTQPNNTVPAARLKVLAAADVLVGRTAAGSDMVLLTELGNLVRLTNDRHVTRARLQGLKPGDQLWGLASLGGSDLWTIANSTTLLRIREGRITERQPLPFAHFAIFSGAGGLLVQALPMEPGGPALTWRASPLSSSVAIGHLRVREVPGPRALTWSRSFVWCGLTTGAITPCWNAFEATIDPIARERAPGPVRLAGLESSAPFDLEGPTDRLPRPVRDAAWLPDGTVLVLTAGPGRASSPDVRELRRYGTDGRLRSLRSLRVSSRLLLRVTATHAWVLARSGELLEVELP